MNSPRISVPFRRHYSHDLLLPLALRAYEVVINEDAWGQLGYVPVGPIMIDKEALRLAVAKHSGRGVDERKLTIFANAVTRDGDRFGWVAFNRSTQSIAVTLRGTHGTDEWMKDVFIVPVPFPFSDVPCGVHAGFLIVYESIRQSLIELTRTTDVQTGDQMIITGHSLGAAVASIAALDLNEHTGGRLTIDVQSFASPRPSDLLFARELRRSGISVLTHWNAPSDIVPGVPVAPFCHPDTVVLIDGDHFLNLRAAHDLIKGYLTGLERLQSDESDLGRFPDCPFIYSETNYGLDDSRMKLAGRSSEKGEAPSPTS